VLRQLAEKIDRLRAHAGDTLERLLYPAEEGHSVPLVPHREQLEQAFPRYLMSPPPKNHALPSLLPSSHF
jgi:hypothetical protein